VSVDVIEHLTRPDRFLEALRDSIAPGMPAVAELWLLLADDGFSWGGTLPHG
jgi:hypothetical protein